MSTFERYLTVWVALCIVVGIALGHFFPSRIPRHRFGRDRQGQHAGGRADLVDDHSHAGEDRFRGFVAGQGALARHRGHALHQLGREAVLDGVPRLALHRLAVQALSSGGPDQQLHRRPHFACGRALHGDGVRLEQPLGRRAAFHAEPGRAQRRDHGVRLRADRGTSPRPVGDHRAMGDVAALGRSLHRRAGHHCADRSAERDRERRERRAHAALVHIAAGFARGACSPRWCFCSASRASRSWRSR